MYMNLLWMIILLRSCVSHSFLPLFMALLSALISVITNLFLFFQSPSFTLLTQVIPLQYAFLLCLNFPSSLSSFPLHLFSTRVTRSSTDIEFNENKRIRNEGGAEDECWRIMRQDLVSPYTPSVPHRHSSDPELIRTENKGAAVDE